MYSLPQNLSYAQVDGERERFNGQLVLQTANNDKQSTDSSFISFTVNQSSTVYVLDSSVNATLESDWLTPANGWTLQIGVAEGLSGAWRGFFLAGGNCLHMLDPALLAVDTRGEALVILAGWSVGGMRIRGV